LNIFTFGKDCKELNLKRVSCPACAKDVLKFFRKSTFPLAEWPKEVIVLKLLSKKLE
jgi:hypothetical protein